MTYDEWREDISRLIDACHYYIQEEACASPFLTEAIGHLATLVRFAVDDVMSAKDDSLSGPFADATWADE